MRLAEIVIDSGLAGRGDVVEAVQVADRDNTPLVVALVRHSGVDELALVAAIKRQARVAIADPAVVEHDAEAIRELSRDTCWRLRVMPLSVAVFDAGPRTLHLAMADPTDAVAIAEVEHLTGCQVEAWLMPLSAIEELVEEAYRSFVTEVIPRKDKARQSKRKGRKSRKSTPYGGTLAVSASTLSRGQADHGDEEDKQRDGRVDAQLAPGKTKPSTVPFHRVSDEASPELRLRALLELLYRKELVTPAEYEDEVRAVMKRHKDEG